MEYTGAKLIDQVMVEIGEATTNSSFRILVLDWLQEGLDTLLLECQGHTFTQFKNTFNTVDGTQDYSFSITNYYCDEVVMARITNPDTPLKYIEYSELMRSTNDLEAEGTPEYFFNLKWDSTALQSKLSLWPIPSSVLTIEVLYRIKSFLLTDNSTVLPFPRHVVSILKKYARAMAYSREGEFNGYKLNIDLFFRQINELKKQRLSKAANLQQNNNELGFNYNTGGVGGYFASRFGISNAIAGVSSVALTVPSFLSVSGSPIETSGTLAISLASQLANRAFMSPDGENGTPSFRALVAADLPNHTHTSSDILGLSSGTVTSVALTVPTGFSITGSPITTSGTLAISLDNQSGNKVLASPSNGSSGTPSFRALVSADIPDLSATYSVISAGGDLSGNLPSPTVAKINGVALGTILNTSGYILIGNGTNISSVAVTGDVTINSSGVTAIGSGKVTNDMLAGSIANAKLTNSTISGIALGSNLANLTVGTGLKLDSDTTYNGGSAKTVLLANTSVVAGTYLNANIIVDAQGRITYAEDGSAGGGSGTVTSVALTVPSFLSVSGSPVTTSGTLAVSLANQNANLVFAGPSTGSPAAPTFRSLVLDDIPSITNAKLAGSIEATKLVGTDIATVGTITTGTWSATTIAVNKGGSGATTLTGILIGNGTSAFTALALAANQSIRRNSGNTDYEAFTPGTGTLSSLNGLSGATQTFATGTTGTDFSIDSTSTTHTFNIPDAGASARGLVTTGTQTLAGAKTFSTSVDSPLFKSSASNGSILNIKQKTFTHTVASGTTTSTLTNEIPAGAFVIGVVIRVTAQVQASGTFSVGISGDTTKWGTTIARTAGTTTSSSNWSSTPMYLAATATSIVLTGTANFNGTGTISGTIYYFDASGPTS